MTLRSEDFIINWPTSKRKFGANDPQPVTRSEVLTIMEEINKKAAVSRPGDVIEIFTRSCVAAAVGLWLNDLNPGTAVLNIDHEPKFEPEKGGYQSKLSITRTPEEMDSYCTKVKRR
jgi:hypothetical protein